MVRPGTAGVVGPLHAGGEERFPLFSLLRAPIPQAELGYRPTCRFSAHWAPTEWQSSRGSLFRIPAAFMTLIRFLLSS